MCSNFGGQIFFGGVRNKGLNKFLSSNFNITVASIKGFLYCQLIAAEIPELRNFFKRVLIQHFISILITFCDGGPLGQSLALNVSYQKYTVNKNGIVLCTLEIGNNLHYYFKQR